MQSVSQHKFATIPPPSIQRSKFDRSAPYKDTFNAGFLNPIFYDEALPGDSFSLNASFFVRLNTPIVPILDNAYFETFFFEVPVRQVWDNWKKFNGEQDNPGDSTDFLIPQMASPPVTGYPIGSTFDKLGIPTGIPDLKHSALPLRAINHIYNTWFRDQNLQDSIPMPTDDGPDDYLDYPLHRRGKRADYFTSSLPWPQKSDQGSVTIPLGGSAPVTTDSPPGGGNFLGIESSLTGDLTTMGAAGTSLEMGGTVAPAAGAMYADLTQATASTINQLRQSIAIQRIFEKDARGGTRYIEVINAHFGVLSPDLRLQRPGYLGGGRSNVNISPVAQTQATGAGITPLANLAAIGTISGSGHGFTKSFTEHTIIIGFACVRADLTYQNCLNRSWSRLTRFDHYWPELATIGEQAVLRKEIDATGDPALDDAVWSYQERHAEYRYKPGLICGEFRSSSAQSLDFWHLSQDLINPVLGATFIEEHPPFERVVATPLEPQFKMDAFFNLNCARPMPMYGIPGLDRL